MRYIENTENNVIFCCGKAVLVYQKGSSEAQILKLPTSQAVPDSEVQAVCIRLSPDEKYLAVACESKVVTVWCTQSWTLEHTHRLVKRPVSIDISSDSSILLVADKNGDVYNFPLRGDVSSENKGSSENGSNAETKNNDNTVEPQPLLGHLSMLLDLVLTDDRKHVITCDRDEKIRVSRYPNSYNIESFCLGHQEFVNQIELLPGTDPMLLSCSGDGTLKLWNYMTGHCLSTVETREHTTSLLHGFEEYCQQRVKDSEEAKRFLPDFPAVKNFAICTQLDQIYVAVVIDRVPALFLYRIEDKKLIHKSTMELEVVPLVVTVLTSGELLVEQNSEAKPLALFKLEQDSLHTILDHQLLLFGQEYKSHFLDGKKELSIDVLYKQRYDNMADYLKKKQERLETEKAVEAGLVPTVKKGRWL